VARELVLALKLRGSRAAADAMAAMIVARCPALEGAVVVPVPPAPERLRRRGFDPATLIAGRLSVRAGLRGSDCLGRPRGDGRQVGRKRASRRAGPTIDAWTDVPGAVLLVDDVHTTGSTLNACARVLKEHGSRQVLAVSFARTLRGT
jgi:predicted amidophosphoribosyltransferase